MRAKRIFDLLLSGLGLVLSLPLAVAIAVAIKLDDRGPIFYGQERVGRYGRPFKSWKFRSMIVATSDVQTRQQARAGDSRITAVGRLLRASAMDELPQLWNIFRGDMSFVGPRPLLSAEVEVNGTGQLVALEQIPGYRARHQVPPGLTGVAQIFADRDIPRRSKFRYDMIYVRQYGSLWLDLRLIALSFWITLRGKWEQRGDKFGRRPGSGPRLAASGRSPVLPTHSNDRRQHARLE